MTPSTSLFFKLKRMSYAWGGLVLALVLMLSAWGRFAGAAELAASPVAGDQAELGYWIGKPFWGRGYCTEAAQALLRYAFTELGLVRVHSCHFARNPASGRVMQKIGMVKEGCRRQHVKKWDKLEDLELYGVLKQEWAGPENQAVKGSSPANEVENS